MYLIEFIINLFKTFVKKMPPQAVIQTPENSLSTVPIPPVVVSPAPKTPMERLYAAAVACIGMDASPRDFAPDELGCMESVDTIYNHAFGHFIGNGKTPTLSTYEGFQFLNHSGNFEVVLNPEPGCIIISPTAYGVGKLSNGHTGIVAKFGIMSNDSETGKWQKNYTIDSWRKRYEQLGGFPVVFFKPI